MATTNPNFLKAAFQSGANWALMTCSTLLCGVASAQMGTPLPLIAVPGIEALFLFTVPLVPGFRRKIIDRFRAQQRAEQQATLDKLLADLSPSQRAICEELRQLCDKTLDCYRRLPAGSALAASSEAQLSSLLRSFVKLLGALNGYRRYLSSMDRKQVEKDLAEVRVDVADDTPGKEMAAITNLKKKRIEILEQRLSRFDKALAGREVISLQLASIEDFLRLLHEQALTLRDPETATLQLEDLALQLQATDETMRDVDCFSAITEEFAQLESLPDLQQVR